MNEYTQTVRHKFLKIYENISPHENALEQIFLYATLNPGTYTVSTVWNDNNVSLSYVVGDPELDEEVSVVIPNSENDISVRLDPVYLTVKLSSAPDSNKISTDILTSPNGRERLDAFLENALAGYLSEN